MAAAAAVACITMAFTRNHTLRNVTLRRWHRVAPATTHPKEARTRPSCLIKSPVQSSLGLSHRYLHQALCRVREAQRSFAEPARASCSEPLGFNAHRTGHDQGDHSVR